MRLHLAFFLAAACLLPALSASAATATPTAPAATASKIRVLLRVPMVYQAPLGVWDKVHEDTCEEASLAMVKGFADGRASFTKAEMEKDLQRLVAWQKKHLGYFESTPASVAAQVAQGQLGLALDVKPVKTAEDIKRELRAGRPVILPTAGKLLANPNFKNGGPPYHMLVVKGYTDGYFITNDPGTRRGQDYYYPQARLVRAVHDLDPKAQTSSPKVMLVPRGRRQ